MSSYTENTDGSVTVALIKGITVDGQTRMSLRLREPTVGDMIAAQATAGGNTALQEVTLIANLAEVSPEAIQSAKMKDYSRLQDALGFLNG